MIVCPEECVEATKHALRQRVYRFAQNIGISSRAVTHVAQNTTHCLITIQDFVAYIIQQISRYKISMCNIVNGDETNCDWALPPKRTLDNKGKRNIEAQSSASSGRCSTLLCVTANGERLYPFVIYLGSKKGTIKKKELKELNGYPKEMKYTTQKNAWMDEETMLEWIEHVWKPFADSRRGMLMLIIDEAKAHMTAKVLRALSELRTIVEIIPGGYTSKLQVCDVGVNRPFKHYYGEQSERFVCGWTNNHPPGEKPKPTRRDVAQWISHAWEKISSDTIMQTWRHIGYISSSAGKQS
jgi:hypothetical protein